MLFDFERGRARPAVRDRRRVDRRPRHPLQARRRRAEPVAGRADRAAVRGLGAVADVPPAARARRCSRCTSALAETAVLGAFLAQDLGLFVLFFDLMLVPFYFLVGHVGRARPRRRDGEDGHLHARRLAADARRGRRRPRCSRARAAGGDLSLRVLATSPANRCPESTQKWIFVAFALAFLIKMPAFPFHGWMPDAYRTMPLPALAVFSGVVSKVAAYGFLRDRAAAVPGRRPGLPDDPAGPRLVSILYGSVMAFTQTERAADPRLLVDGPARVHHARASSPPTARPPARRARCCRRSTTGSWWRRCSSSSRCWPSARRARRTSATWAASRSARRCWPRCSWSPRSPRSRCPARRTSSASS